MDAIAFAIQKALDRLEGLPHQHHRHCVHNLSADEQRAAWRRRCDSDEDYEIVYGRAEPLVITPDDWEIDVPDLDWGDE